MSSSRCRWAPCRPQAACAEGGAKVWRHEKGAAFSLYRRRFAFTSWEDVLCQRRAHFEDLAFNFGSVFFLFFFSFLSFIIFFGHFYPGTGRCSLRKVSSSLSLRSVTVLLPAQTTRFLCFKKKKKKGLRRNCLFYKCLNKKKFTPMDMNYYLHLFYYY